MSNLPELLAPIAPPAPAERPAPQRQDKSNSSSEFADRLDAEASEKPAPRESDQARETNTTDETSAQADASEATGTTEQNDGQQPSDDDAPAGDAALSDDDATIDAQPAQLIVAPIQPDLVEAPAELAVTALSGQSMPLTPPTGKNADEPGALAKWFVEAAGPANAATGQLAQAQGSTALTQPGMANLQSMDEQGAMSGPATSGMAGDEVLSFADALASSNADVDGLDSFIAQAAAKLSAATDASGQALPQLTTGQTLTTGAQTAMTAVPQGATGQAVPVTALAVEITRQATNGKTQFDIRLDPPELGRVSVRLEMDGAGQTRTHMIVERAETLDMLTTDARNLERALQQAGLKADPGSVSFELAQDMADGFTDGQQSAGSEDSSNNAGTSAEDATSAGINGLDDDGLTTPEAIVQQMYATGHLDVRV